MKRGFSLIEMVMTLSILGIVVAIAAPRYSGASDGYKLQAGERQMIASIESWIERAQRTSTAHSIVFVPTKNMIVLFEGEAKDREAMVDSLDIGASPFGIDLIKTSLDDPKDQLFINGFGIMDQDAVIQISKGDLAMVVTLNGGTSETPKDSPEPVDLEDLAEAVVDALSSLLGS